MQDILKLQEESHQRFFRVRKICQRQIVELLSEASYGASFRSSSHRII